MSVNLIEAAGPVLMIAVVAALAACRLSPPIRIAAAVAGAMLALIPFDSQSFATFMLGLLGPVSAASLVLLGTSLVALLRGTRSRPSITMLVALIVIGAIFYPLTLGLTVFDPYEFGYRGVAVPGLMLVLVAIGWWKRAIDVSCWIALAGLLYALGAYDSRNLWDYLIFPLDPVCAAVIFAVWLISERHSDPVPDSKSRTAA